MPFAIYRKWGNENTTLSSPMAQGFDTESEAQEWFDKEVAEGRRNKVAIYIKEYVQIELIALKDLF